MSNYKKSTRDLSWYKKNIPLVDFILYTNKGYYLDKNSTKANPKLFLPKKDIFNNLVLKPGGSPEKDSVLVFSKSKNDGHFLYWDAVGGGIERGQSKTIIDFIIDHLIPSGEFDYLFIINYLENYLKSDKSISLEASKFNLNNNTSLNNNTFPELDLYDYKDYSYLTSRGISTSTIENPIFYSTIKHYDEILELKDEFTGKIKKITNQYVGFVLVNENGVQGVNLKKLLPSGGKFQKILGNKQSTAYLSRANSKTKEYEEFFICEATEDCMADFQIREPKFKIRYFATSGQVTSAQCELISKQSQIYKISKFVLANDKDTTGAYYNAKILSLINIEGVNDSNITFQCFKSNKSNYLTIFYNKNESKVSFESLLKTISNYLGHKEFRVINTLLSELVTEIKITFLASWQNWDMIARLILKLKFDNTEKIEIRVPNTIDWNEDLQNL